MGQTRGQWGPQRQCPALPIQDQNPWLQPATGDRARLPAQLPPKCVLALGPEEVDVRLELQLEDVLLEDAVGLLGHTHAVAQQREAGQGVVVLQGGAGPSVGVALPARHPPAPGSRVRRPTAGAGGRGGLPT